MGDFMRPEIFQDTFLEVETSAGTWFLPADMVVLSPSSLTEEWCQGEGLEAVEPFVAGEPAEIKIRKDVWGARLSAPGYLDRTDWTIHNSREQAAEYLR